MIWYDIIININYQWSVSNENIMNFRSDHWSGSVVGVGGSEIPLPLLQMRDFCGSFYREDRETQTLKNLAPAFRTTAPATRDPH